MMPPSAPSPYEASLGTYPFGQPLRRVVQVDRSPKRAFVLGVYSSAVHARWIGPGGRSLVTALAVASEPYIFWRGDEVEAIIGKIAIPGCAGKLVPAGAQLNGPSGQALDDKVLTPLGLTRGDTWLCDLVPHTCLNPKQKAALAREYEPRMAAMGLPAVRLPDVPTSFADDIRRHEVLGELIESRADTLILLGDEPIHHWLRHFLPRWQHLSDFPGYGVLHESELPGWKGRLLPLAHVRQIGALGAHSPKWFEAHQGWMSRSQRAMSLPRSAE
jgi:hypothetical protein